MIHLLEVDPSLTPAALNKLARRFAMTGGVELTLRPGLSADDLRSLVDIYLPQIEKFHGRNSEIRSSHAYRILTMVKEHPCVQKAARDVVESFLKNKAESTA